MKLLKKLDGVSSSQELLEKHFGDTKHIGLARMGDIVLARNGAFDLGLIASMDFFGSVPGVCFGPISYFVGEAGLVEVETLKLDKALWVS